MHLLTLLTSIALVLIGPAVTLPVLNARGGVSDSLSASQGYQNQANTVVAVNPDASTNDGTTVTTDYSNGGVVAAPATGTTDQGCSGTSDAPFTACSNTGFMHADSSRFFQTIHGRKIS